MCFLGFHTWKEYVDFDDSTNIFYVKARYRHCNKCKKWQQLTWGWNDCKNPLDNPESILMLFVDK